MITEQHYANLERLREPGTEALAKDRISFLWNGFSRTRSPTSSAS